MKKNILLNCLILFICNLLSAQTITVDPGSTPVEPTKRNILNISKMRIQYRQVIIQDTTNVSKKTDNIMLLQIGNNISKYVDFYGLIGDSLVNAYTKEGVDFSIIFTRTQPYIKGSSREKIFKNYPKGKITTTNFFAGSSYLYEEASVNIDWKLESGNMTIAGYKCKKASTTLFGRRYTAWYAPDIPISNGPWKFSGLPGLILKVEDNKKQVFFECIAIDKPRWEDQIYISENNYMKTSKKAFLKLYKQYQDNPGAALQNSGMIQGDIPVKAFRKKAYNPIELSE
ncbi:MAG: GLPGLI family protein [Dysgonomonas sp.]